MNALSLWPAHTTHPFLHAVAIRRIILTPFGWKSHFLVRAQTRNRPLPRERQECHDFQSNSIRYLLSAAALGQGCQCRTNYRYSCMMSFLWFWVRNHIVFERLAIELNHGVLLQPFPARTRLRVWYQCKCDFSTNTPWENVPTSYLLCSDPLSSPIQLMLHVPATLNTNQAELFRELDFFFKKSLL